MQNWLKTVFNSTLITSAFLNSLQDFAMKRAVKFIPYDDSLVQMPGNLVTADLLNDDFVLKTEPYFEPMVGDIVVGIKSGKMAKITSYGQTTTAVVGMAYRFLYEYVTSASVPASASVNSTGLISFKNDQDSTLFTLQLPLYSGGVE